MESVRDQNLFVFVLGREKEIARAELEAVLNRCGFRYQILFEGGPQSGAIRELSETSRLRSKNNPDRLSVSGNLVFINLDRDETEVAQLIDVLGGTTKIFHILNCHSDRCGVESGGIFLGTDEHYRDKRSLDYARDDKGRGYRDNAVKEIVDLIAESQHASGKLDFGISDYSNSFSTKAINALGLEVKKELKQQGISSRFVALREGKELSSIQTLKNKLDMDGVEIGLFSQGIGKLIALSNPEEWSKRDYGKPAGDRYSGMVPPKLARAMINIALAQQIPNSKVQSPNKNLNGQSTKEESPRPLGEGQGEGFDIRNSDLDICDCGAIVLDPFCGSGNILMEAMLLGCEVIGSDISEKAVRDTETNLNWLLDNYELRITNYHPPVFKADATSEESVDQLNSQFAIRTHQFVMVTEPYLGEPKKFKPSWNSAQGEYRKIRELYLEFLKNLKSLEIRNSQFAIALIFPLVETLEGKRYSLFKESVDEIKSLGYTETRPSLLYGRDYQVVKREIVFLQLNN